MTIVSIHSSNGKLHCELSKGRYVAKGEAKTILSALMKTYVKLIIGRIKVFKWREMWTEH